MKVNNNKDVFLAKWISGDLSDSDLKILVTPEDYASFLMIRESLVNMKSPAPPNIELAYLQLKDKIICTEYPVAKKPIEMSRLISIAACFLILLTLGSYQGGLFGGKEYATTAESKNIYFGDNVAVTLDQNTVINQKAPLFNSKTIHLKEGRAYFEVENGTHFFIRTSHGNVEVLGTKFTVKVNKDLFEVKCFEGKVKVSYQDSIYYVNKETQFNSIQKEVKHLGIEPNWFSKYKNFNKSDLEYVIDFMEQTYNVSIVYPSNFLNSKFTGTIPVDNLEDALSLICYSFNLKFEVHDKNVIIKK